METGSAITWKYPSCILQGENSVGEFYSVAVTNNHQQADTGTKMIHEGNTRSRIISGDRQPWQPDLSRAGARLGEGRRRAQLHAVRLAADRRSLAAPIPFPISNAGTERLRSSTKATTSKISEDQLFYRRQRGIGRRTQSR